MTKFRFLFFVSFLGLLFNSCVQNDSGSLKSYFERLNEAIPYNKKVLFQSEPLDSSGKNIASIKNEIDSTLSLTGVKFRFDYYVTKNKSSILIDSIRSTAIGIAYYYYLKDWEFNGEILSNECRKIQEYRFLKSTNLRHSQNPG